MDQLLEIMRRLRDPESGCPWDVEQDFQTIAPYTIEEAYEVAGAIEDEDPAALQDELGDLLFQVVFHSQMASEQKWFGFDDVVNSISDKMLRRHPHVFGDAQVASSDAQTEAWEAMKAEERSAKGDTSVLAGISSGLPEWMRAVKLQKRAARVGFDWSCAQDVFPKLAEELDELNEAVADQQQAAIEEEFGDLLFVMMNLSRHLNVDAGRALRQANRKFESRFRTMEALAEDRDIDLAGSDLSDLDALWDEAKQREKSAAGSIR